ncbi:RICIN domain-containing protein [Micromonospora sp. WMMD718]|uniref:RICIN domain-containing protein n=1 Tax=Micromonospora sp. WMMD718 TaxID=3016098 RepID=UPI002416C0AC|nr:RICIN domain-containing protein [Micromonospora sp. WMMD718]MDG4749932.1 RICIN domain-containing protein [Micromonospora sp. WMMD718]
MRNKVIRAAVSAAVTAALAVAVSPAAAHAETDDRASVPISAVLSPTKSLAAVPVAVKNKKSSKFLQADSTANNAVVRQQNGSGSSLQGWILVNDSGYTTLQNYGVVRNLGTAGASTASNTSAVIVNPSSSFDQDWVVSAIDDTFFYLRNRKNTSMCLGIDGASTAAGARAAIYTCANAINQTWSFTNF